MWLQSFWLKVVAWIVPCPNLGAGATAFSAEKSTLSLFNIVTWCSVQFCVYFNLLTDCIRWS